MVTQYRLHQLLSYDPESGNFTWIDKRKRNNRCGMIAGCIKASVDGAGRVVIRVDGVLYQAHRLAWVYVFGCDPENEIDHINGNPSDNRICNLRCVTSLENKRNMKKQSTNTSGFNGVSFDSQTGKWRAKIKITGKTICLGRYACIDDAISARKEANKTYGFHDNHGAR